MAFGGADACAVAADEARPVAADEARPDEAGDEGEEGVPEWPAVVADEAIAVPVCVLVDAAVGE